MGAECASPRKNVRLRRLLKPTRISRKAHALAPYSPPCRGFANVKCARGQERTSQTAMLVATTLLVELQNGEANRREITTNNGYQSGLLRGWKEGRRVYEKSTTPFEHGGGIMNVPHVAQQQDVMLQRCCLNGWLGEYLPPTVQVHRHIATELNECHHANSSTPYQCQQRQGGVRRVEEALKRRIQSLNNQPVSSAMSPAYATIGTTSRTLMTC